MNVRKSLIRVLTAALIVLPIIAKTSSAAVIPAHQTITRQGPATSLQCHQDNYKRKKVNGTFVPDTGLMTVSIDQAAQTVHRTSSLPWTPAFIFQPGTSKVPYNQAS